MWRVHLGKAKKIVGWQRLAIDFQGGKRRRNIKMRAQLMIFIWRAKMTEKNSKYFKTTLLTFRCGRATSSE